MSSMFPYKLHKMLEYVENSGMESVVSWLPHGRAFKVHKPEAFMKTVVPVFFKQNKYKSFQRQLHLYGFERITEGKDKGKIRVLSDLLASCISEFLGRALKPKFQEHISTRTL